MFTTVVKAISTPARLTCLELELHMHGTMLPRTPQCSLAGLLTSSLRIVAFYGGVSP
jgi:hypothetical protein